MWAAIESNKRRSWILIGLMGLLLVGLGFTAGFTYQAEAGGFIGAGAAVFVWLIMTLTALYGGDSLLLSSAGAARIQKEDAPQFWNVAEEMTIASGLGKMPRLYVIDNDAPNAFAVGRKPEKAAVAVTSGLLKRLNRDELQGVVAHEIAHIQNLDVRFMTLAAVMVGAIVLVSDVFLRSLWFGGGRRRSSSRGGGQAQLVMVVVAILFAILAPLAAQLLYFACSRRREYLADACAARYTRYPEGLASALEKISARSSRKSKVSRSLAPLYIVNPLQSAVSAGLTSTHPPTQARIAILRGMAGGADFRAYEAAFQKVQGKDQHCLSPAEVKGEEAVPIRQPTRETDKRQAAVDRAREAVDLIDRLTEFLLIPCACGVRIKVPPTLKRESIGCPRCGTVHPVPLVETAGQTKAGAGKTPPPASYRRRGAGWESFKCSCGRSVQLSPKFSASHIRCPGCRNKIKIDR